MMNQSKPKGEKRQNTLEEIADEIKKHDKVFLFSHIAADGDGLGASVALQCALKKMGKEAYVVMEDEVPDFISFIVNENCIGLTDGLSPADLSIAVDCADSRRFLKRQRLFFGAGTTVNVDHHESNDYFADFNHVRMDSASACEIVYRLIKTMGVEIDKEIATAIYVGVSTDTGSFQYANTTVETHMIAADLFRTGIDVVRINSHLFQGDSMQRRKLISEVLGNLEVVFDGNISVACITLDMIAKTGAKAGDTEGCVDEVRKVRGVEVAVLLKEIDEKTTKVSLRSKEFVDVNKIAAKFDGGGHKRAAGCRISAGIKDSKEILMKELQGLNWNEWNNQLKQT